MNSCRLCLVLREDTCNIFESTSDISAQNIQDCVNINIDENDLLSKRICLICCKKVRDWLEFRKQCHEVQSILSNVDKDMIKVEHVIKIEDIDEDEEHENDTWNDTWNMDDCNETDEITIEEYLEELDFKDEPSYVTFNEIESEFTYEQNSFNSELVSDIWSCDICKKKFTFFTDYFDHQVTHDGEPAFKCDRCEKVFTSRKLLLKHDQNHDVVCNYCGKQMLSKSLAVHLHLHSNRYSCPICSKAFSSVTHRDLHVEAIHANIKNHVCETCGKPFAYESSLKLHMRTHKEERLFACKKCPYSGRTRSALYIHSFTHFSKNSFICEICARPFKSPFRLNAHRKSVHEKIVRFKCSFCPMEFFKKSKYIRHMRCHTGEKPYKCNECGKTFNRQDALKEHGQVHEKTDFICDKCGRSFRCKRSVRRHVCTSNEEQTLIKFEDHDSMIF